MSNKEGTGEPVPIDRIQELRAAVGLFDGAMPATPKEAWEEAITLAKVHRQAIAAHIAAGSMRLYVPRPEAGK